jgi:NurA-like 5'-3' nuclease
MELLSEKQDLKEEISEFIEQTEKLKSIMESIRTEENEDKGFVTQLKILEKIVLDNKARLDVLDASVRELSKKIDLIHEFAEKFKLLETILEDAKRVDQKLRSLEESREEAKITAQKLQKMYSDFQNTLKELVMLKNELENMKKLFSEYKT